MTADRTVQFDENAWASITEAAANADETPEEYIHRVTWDALLDEESEDLPFEENDTEENQP